MFDLDLATQSKDKYEVKLSLVDTDSNKWEEHMSLDEHTQSTVLADLIGNYCGASRYLEDTWKPTEITRTLVCRLKSQKKTLNLQKLICKEDQVQFNPEATHVVVGITYGADAYCVLSQNLDEEAIKNYRKVTENLSNSAIELKTFLRNRQTLNEFKNDLDAIKTRRINCRLFADLQTQFDSNRNLCDAYNDCLELIEHIVVEHDPDDKAIPITVFLCPLKRAGSSLINYNIDSARVECCYFELKKLERIKGNAKSLLSLAKGTNRQSLLQFRNAVAKYEQLLKTGLKKGVLEARREANWNDEEFESIYNIACDHKLFKYQQLEKWATYKESEMDMEDFMAKTGITYFANVKQMKVKLTDSDDKKFTLALCIPLLGEWTDGFLEEMKSYLEENKELVADGNYDDEDDIPWHTDPRKQKKVLDRIRQFSDFAGENKHLTGQVQYFVCAMNTFTDRGEKLDSSYCIYKGAKIFKKTLAHLPNPPTGLRIQLQCNGHAKRIKKSSILVKWNYEDNDLPCTFVVEYRSIGASADSWAKQKTTKAGQRETIISCENGSLLEIRVAAETCIGRSEFSEVLYAESAIDGGDVPERNQNDESEDIEIHVVRKRKCRVVLTVE